MSSSTRYFFCFINQNFQNLQDFHHKCEAFHAEQLFCCYHWLPMQNCCEMQCRAHIFKCHPKTATKIDGAARGDAKKCWVPTGLTGRGWTCKRRPITTRLHTKCKTTAATTAQLATTGNNVWGKCGEHSGQCRAACNTTASKRGTFASRTFSVHHHSIEAHAFG